MTEKPLIYHPPRPEMRGSYQIILFILLILVGGLIIVGKYFSQYNKNWKSQLEKGAQVQLSEEVDLKVKQLVNWRNEQLRLGELIFNQPLFMPVIQQWLKNPSDKDLEYQVKTWLKILSNDINYKNLILVDDAENIRLSVPQADQNLPDCIRPYLTEARKTKKAILTDLHQEANASSIHLALVIPFFEFPFAEEKPFGFIVVLIDPHQFFYPFIQSRAILSKTGENLLVRREGEEVVYLNELRFQPNTALHLRIPIHQKDLVEAMAVAGKEGWTEGINYRGKRVFAAIRKVPGTPWFLLSTVDQEEVYGLIRNQNMLLTLDFCLLIIVTGTFIGFLWRHQRANWFKKLYQAERNLAIEQAKREEDLRKYQEKLEREVSDRTSQLSETNRALKTEIAERKQAESQLRMFRQFAEYSGQGLGMATLDAKITYVNPTLAKILGEETPEAAYGKKFPDYYPPEMCDQLYQEIIPRVLKEGQWKGELAIISRRGKVTPTLENLFLIRDESGNPVCLADVITDISELKEIEAELKRHREYLEELVAERTAEVKRLAQENGILAEIGKMISSSLDISEVYERFTEKVKELINFDRIAINLIDYNKEEVTISYVGGKEVPGLKVGDSVSLAGSTGELLSQLKTSLLIQGEEEWGKCPELMSI